MMTEIFNTEVLKKWTKAQDYSSVVIRAENIKSLLQSKSIVTETEEFEVCR